MIRDDLLHGDDVASERAFLEASKMADGIEVTGGKEAGDNIFQIATGTVIPLQEYLEEWLADKGFTGKTALPHRKAFAVLHDWLKASNFSTTINTSRGGSLGFTSRHTSRLLSERPRPSTVT